MNIRLLLILCAFTNLHALYGQYTFKARILDSDTREPLSGATAFVQGIQKGAIADNEGYVTIMDISEGSHKIEFRYIGYHIQTKTYNFPSASTENIDVLLESDAGELEEVIITSTRSTRTIQDIPTRVESIAGEELEEKSNMKSGDIRMLLSESTGIQTQQTSATSANASIRIQGLDGRYTQILKDGFPLYSGAASGLGLLQIPPLDLQQVEVIKGSASTLYGGGAIAGIVNLISKVPSEESELRFHINGTSGGGFDLNGFYSQRSGKVGTTVFASNNQNRVYDPAGIDLSAIPRFNRFVLNPRLFVYFNNNTTMNFGLNSVIEDRLGGDIHIINGDVIPDHSYFEENKTQRYSAQFSIDHHFSKNKSLNIKNSLSHFNRKITIPDYNFNGSQIALFSEVAYTSIGEKAEWVSGINVWTDDFNEKQFDTSRVRDYTQVTMGAFIQNSWKTTDMIDLETGFRADYIIDYGFVFLPRISVLFKFAENFSSRFGGGFGYKAPTIFTEESEKIQYQHVSPIDSKKNVLERSYGINLDVNYRTIIAKNLTFSINQLFFYTRLNRPLLLELQPGTKYTLINSKGILDTRGTETNIKFGFNDFKLFIGYTYTDARLNHNGKNVENPLTPKHRINSVLMYETEDKWKVGVESYYFSRQKLSDGSFGKPYIIMGLMAERLWDKFSVYVNFENFLDVRQTRFDTIYTGTITNPVFRDIYAPLDGFIINAGIKLKLLR